MKTLLRAWTLILDFVMLVMLFAAPVPAPVPVAAQQAPGERIRNT